MFIGSSNIGSSNTSTKSRTSLIGFPRLSACHLVLSASSFDPPPDSCGTLSVSWLRARSLPAYQDSRIGPQPFPSGDRKGRCTLPGSGPITEERRRAQRNAHRTSPVAASVGAAPGPHLSPSSQKRHGNTTNGSLTWPKQNSTSTTSTR